MQVSFSQTTSDEVYTIATGATATFRSNGINTARVLNVEILNLGATIGTIQIDGGPVRTVLGGERLSIMRNAQQVSSVSGSFEVVFSL